MSPAEALPSSVKPLLESAAEWRLLGLLFEYPTDAWRAHVQALLSSLPRPDLRALAEAAMQYHTEGLHTALFGPAGTVPVREVAHQGGVQFGYLMSELTAYYDAFGYAPAVEEASDHLAVQLGFVSWLRMKQALALTEGRAEQASVSEESASAFLKDHIAVQAGPVLRRLEEFGPDYLIEAARLILQYAGPAPRTSYPLSAALTDDEGEELSCGPAQDDLVSLIGPPSVPSL